MMNTPDVSALAKQARKTGTVLAVVEFLCRTRAEFTFAELVAECPKLGVAPPTEFRGALLIMREACDTDLCERGTSPSGRTVWISKVTGKAS